MSKLKQSITPFPSPRIRSAAKRLKVLQSLSGTWKNRKTDPIQELEELRRDSDRTYER